MQEITLIQHALKMPKVKKLKPETKKSELTHRVEQSYTRWILYRFY